MTASDDPFEAAARNEHEAWLRRRVLGRGGLRARESRGVLVAFVVFGGPYVLWAASAPRATAGVQGSDMR